MRDIPGALLAHLGLEVTTLAVCWRLDRKDGQSFFYTDHDADIVFEGDTYASETGFTRSAVELSLDMAVGTSDVVGFFKTDQITENDVLAGKLDDAEIRMFVVNWADPTMGRVRMLRGWLGVISRQDGAFTCEIRSLTQLLQNNVANLCTGRCRSDFGDAGGGTGGGCRFTVPMTATSVGAVTDRKTFGHGGGGGAGAGGTLDGGYFALGTVTFTSGANAGISRPIDTDDGGVLSLFLAAPFDVAPGDGIELRPGCDKTLEVCRDNWNNLVNFRGEPYVPGSDVLFKIQRARGGGGKK